MPARRDPANHLHTEPAEATLADILAFAIPAWTEDAACASKIGRASCRERV